MTKGQTPTLDEMKPRIVVMGVGGGGGNAINNMLGSNLTGPKFIVANTDAQALSVSAAEHRIQLGARLTEGIGAGAKHDIGQKAAEEALEDIRSALEDAHMVFIAAGMGGGTGTGAAPVIARVAKELGILAVAVVTKPFQFEGKRRMAVAEIGITELERHVDTLIVIPNQNLFNIVSDTTAFADAFVLADQVLYAGVKCIVDLVVKDGLINLDLADVRTVLSGMGRAMLGMGEAFGEQRAIVAAEEAIVNPLLDEVTLKGAKSLLLCITGGRDLTLWEVEEAASRVCQEVDPDANIIVGATFDEGLGDRIRVSIVASGMPRATIAGPAREVDAPTWTPRAQREPDDATDNFGRRLTEAISDSDAQGRARAPRSRTKDRRPPSEGENKKDGVAKAPRQPPVGRARRASGPKKPPNGGPPRLHQVPFDTERSEISHRGLRTPPPLEDHDGARWPERSGATSEVANPMPRLEPPTAHLREAHALPRKTGFLQRLGFGRVRREA